MRFRFAAVLTLALPAALLSQATPARTVVRSPSWHAAPAVWHVGTTPIVDVGGLQSNPENEFDPRMGYLRASMLSDGGLAVIDDYRVHFFDAKGALRKIVGRRGAGPADFNYITGICRMRGDTILLNDSRNHRIAVIDRNGKVIRTNPLGIEGSPPFNFCLPDGSYIVQKAEDHESGRPARISVTRVSLDGKILGSFIAGTALGYDAVVQGEPIISAGTGGVLFHGRLTNDATLFDVAGTKALVMETADPARTIASGESERNIVGSIPKETPAAERRARVAAGEARAHAATWPPYFEGMLGSDGMAWLMVYPIDYQGPHDWVGFDPGGRLVARFQLPAAEAGKPSPQILGFGNRTVMVMRFDEDGARHITVYPLLPGAK